MSDELQSVDSFVDNIVSTISNNQEGDKSQTVNVDDSQDSTVVNNTEDTIAEDSEQQDNAVKPEAVKADGDKANSQEGTSSVDKAVEQLQKLLGKELSDEEAVEEMAKTVMNATPKIQQLTEDVKDLAGRTKQWETWYESNNIPEMIELMSNPIVQKAIEQARGGASYDSGEESLFQNEIPQEVKSELASLKKELAELKSGTVQQETNKKSQEHVNLIKEFSNKNSDYKELLNEYAERVKLNPYAKLPEKLNQWDKLVKNGVDADKAWKVLNEDTLTKKITEDISKKQSEKRNNAGILPKSSSKAPKNYDETQNFDDFFSTVVERARQSK
jgi:uncharacterized protein YoaH (UPF0181 family)